VSSATFNVDQWTAVPADSLSGVDRTMGFYTPTPNMPGLSLPLLIEGDQYPGVQVQAPNFDQNAGYDLGNYSINPFDNLFHGPEGRPTYDPGMLDAAYASSYLDTFLGTRPTDINVDGGGYIDVYSSYAPEELVPGSEFDTLDFRVYTTGGPTNGADFRIFQDMRGLQLSYVINDATTTTLTQDLSTTDDTIYVDNAGALSVPNLAANQWGALTVGAERIMYREIDLENNTVSGLLRGTAGTAITAHDSGDAVYNIGRDNLFSRQYQNYIVETTALADGSTTVFAAPNITLSTSSTAWVISNTYSSGDIVVNSGSFYSAKQDVLGLLNIAITNTDYWQPLAAAVEVYVGGIRLTADLYAVTDQAPVSVTLDAAPPDGVAVTILVRRGTWIE
jgi:hypothetical protein